MAHTHAQFAHTVAGAMKQENDLRFRIILRIPMGKCADHRSIGCAKAARAVGHGQAAERANERSQHPGAEFANRGLIIFGLFQKTGADDQIDMSLHQIFDKPADLRRTVLSIPINLNSYFIPVQGRVAVAGLHRSADSQVERQADNRRIRRDLPRGVVGGTVIHHEHVVFREGTPQALNHLANAGSLIKNRNDHQPAEGRLCGMAAMHGMCWAHLCSITDLHPLDEYCLVMRRDGCV